MSEFYFVVETGELSTPGNKEDSGIVSVGGYVFGKIDVGRKMALYTRYGRENGYWVTECTFLAEVEIESILPGGCTEECSVQSAEDSYVIITFKKLHSGTELRSIEPFDFVGISERVSTHERNPYFEAIFRWMKCADDFRTEEMLTKEQRFERKERLNLLKRYILLQMIYDFDFNTVEYCLDDMECNEDGELEFPDEYESDFAKIALSDGKQAVPLFTSQIYEDRWLEQTGGLSDNAGITNLSLEEFFSTLANWDEFDANNPEFDHLFLIDPTEPHSFLLDEMMMKSLLEVYFDRWSESIYRGRKEIQEKMKSISPQVEGYINRNWQKNIGRVSAWVGSGSTDEGTCHAGKGKVAAGGTFFQMKCMMCGEVYTARSSSIKIKKCPNCQGGKS